MDELLFSVINENEFLTKSKFDDVYDGFVVVVMLWMCQPDQSDISATITESVGGVVPWKIG